MSPPSYLYALGASGKKTMNVFLGSARSLLLVDQAIGILQHFLKWDRVHRLCNGRQICNGKPPELLNNL